MEFDLQAYEETFTSIWDTIDGTSDLALRTSFLFSTCRMIVETPFHPESEHTSMHLFIPKHHYHQKHWPDADYKPQPWPLRSSDVTQRLEELRPTGKPRVPVRRPGIW